MLADVYMSQADTSSGLTLAMYKAELTASCSGSHKQPGYLSISV